MMNSTWSAISQPYESPCWCCLSIIIFPLLYVNVLVDYRKSSRAKWAGIKKINIIQAYHSGPLLMAAASSTHGFSSPSAAHDPLQPSAGVQDTVCPLHHSPGPQSISQHSWPTLHSPMDDIFSRVTSAPLSERMRHNKGAYSSQREHLILTTASVSCNSPSADINWVWTNMKDTANSHLNVCIWKILLGAGSWSEAMLVLVQNSTWVPDFVLFLSRGPSQLRQTAGCVCLFTEL